MALTLVLDLSASLAMGLVDASGPVRASRVKEKAKGEEAHGILDDLLAEAGVGLRDIREIAVGIGPGSFTGIRVAVALAQGLAFAERLPLRPFSTLAALRACTPGGISGRSVAAIAANAGRWYVSSGEPAVEALRTSEELIALSPSGFPLITYGPVPEPDRLAAFPARHRFEDIVDFGRVLALAKAGAPVLDGVVRPNYLMESAAEAKRLAAGAAAADSRRPAEGAGP